MGEHAGIPLKAAERRIVKAILTERYVEIVVGCAITESVARINIQRHEDGAILTSNRRVSILYHADSRNYTGLVVCTVEGVVRATGSLAVEIPGVHLLELVHLLVDVDRMELGQSADYQLALLVDEVAVAGHRALKTVEISALVFDTGLRYS